FSLSLETEDRFVRAGEHVVVSINSRNFHHVAGLQCALVLMEAICTRVGSGALDIADGFAIHDNGSLVILSWSDGVLRTVAPDQTLFTISFTALRDGFIRDMLTLAPDVRRHESYIGAGPD